MFQIESLNSKVAALVGLTILLSACDKGAGSFSVLSENADFQQTAVYEPRKLDVLFVVDNSGSMSSSQQALANNFSSFIDRFISKGYNFKIAVTTTDAFYGEQFVNNGCSICNINQTRFRSGVTPSPVYVIDANQYDLTLPTEQVRLKNEFSLNAKVGTSGSGDERAFSSFKAALGSSLNANFHRPDAFLAVIIVSDEEDFSQGAADGSTGFSMNESYSNPLLHTVESYKTFLDNFTNATSGKDYSVSTISILDSACQTQLGAGRKIATRYIQLADLTGGTKNSLCAPFDTTLDNISTTIEGQVQAVFKLNRKPVISSILVMVDGVSVPQDSVSGWSYDQVTNSITINGAAYQPHSGSSVSIAFDPDLN